MPLAYLLELTFQSTQSLVETGIDRFARGFLCLWGRRSVPCSSTTQWRIKPCRTSFRFKLRFVIPSPFVRRAVVCDVATAKIAFDNYERRWGEQKQLDRFLQGYAVEKAKIEARKKGHSVSEQPLEDGSIKLTVSVGGAV